jgi:mono/diheme cytochrome c family protein
MTTVVWAAQTQEVEEEHAAEVAPPGGGGEETPTTPAEPAGDAAAGKQVFESAGCTSCHTLADAGATGTIGPNLDEAKPPASLVVERVTNGKPPMPSFKGQLSEQQIQDVAAYVSSAAGAS